MQHANPIMVAMHQPVAVELCEDVLVNILSRLPTADLSRYKCVSKQWYRRLVPLILTQRPNLALVGFQYIGKPHFLSFSGDNGIHEDNYYSCNSPFKTTDFEGCLPQAILLCVCNGALATMCKSGHSVTMYALHNPFTCQTSIMLPPPPAEKASSHDRFTFLAFDPRLSSRHFKMVSYMPFQEEPFLYSSETKKWRPLVTCEFLPANWYTPRMDSYCINGIAYKMASDKREPIPEIIAAFDIKKERLWWITCPAFDETGPFYNYELHTLGESAGHLCFAHCRPRLRSLDLYMLKKHNSSGSLWILRHRINLQIVQFSLRDDQGFSFYFHPMDEEVLFMTYYDTLYLCSSKRSELQEVGKLDRRAVDFIYPYSCPR